MRNITLMKEARFAKQGETLTAVALPHTWNNLDGQDGGNDYWRGIGTYEIDKASYEQAIDNAKTLEEVASALSSALDDINAKKAEIDNKPVKKGCFGSVLPSIMGIAALLGTCIVCRRKKEE